MTWSQYQIKNSIKDDTNAIYYSGYDKTITYNGNDDDFKIATKVHQHPNGYDTLANPDNNSFGEYDTSNCAEIFRNGNKCRFMLNFLSQGMTISNYQADNGSPNFSDGGTIYNTYGNGTYISGWLSKSGNEIWEGSPTISPSQSFFRSGYEYLIKNIISNNGYSIEFEIHKDVPEFSGETTAVFKENKLPNFKNFEGSRQIWYQQKTDTNCTGNTYTFKKYNGTNGKVLNPLTTDRMSITKSNTQLDLQSYQTLVKIDYISGEYVSTINLNTIGSCNITYWIEAEDQNQPWIFNNVSGDGKYSAREHCCKNCKKDYNGSLSTFQTLGTDNNFFCQKIGQLNSSLLQKFTKNCQLLNVCSGYEENYPEGLYASDLTDAMLSRDIYLRQTAVGINDWRIGRTNQPSVHYLAGMDNPTQDQSDCTSISWINAGKWGKIENKYPLANDEMDPIYQIYYGSILPSGSGILCGPYVKYDRAYTLDYNAPEIWNNGDNYYENENYHGSRELSTIDIHTYADIPSTNNGNFAVQRLAKHRLSFSNVTPKSSWQSIENQEIKQSYRRINDTIELKFENKRNFPIKLSGIVDTYSISGDILYCYFKPEETTVQKYAGGSIQQQTRFVGGNIVRPKPNEKITNTASHLATYGTSLIGLCKGDSLSISGYPSGHITCIYAQSQYGSYFEEYRNFSGYPNVPINYMNYDSGERANKEDIGVFFLEGNIKSLLNSGYDLQNKIVYFSNDSVLPPLKGVIFTEGNTLQEIETAHQLQIRIKDENYDNYVSGNVDTANGLISFAIPSGQIESQTFDMKIYCNSGNPYILSRENNLPYNLFDNEIENQHKQLQWYDYGGVANEKALYVSRLNTTQLVSAMSISGITSDCYIDKPLILLNNNQSSGDWSLRDVTNAESYSVGLFGHYIANDSAAISGIFDCQTYQFNPLQRWTSDLIDDAYIKLKISGLRTYHYSGYYSGINDRQDWTYTITSGEQPVKLATFKIITPSGNLPQICNNIEFIGVSETLNIEPNKWKSINIKTLMQQTADMINSNPNEKIYITVVPESLIDNIGSKDFYQIFKDFIEQFNITYVSGAYTNYNYKYNYINYAGAYFGNVLLKVNHDSIQTYPDLFYINNRFSYFPYQS